MKCMSVWPSIRYLYSHQTHNTLPEVTIRHPVHVCSSIADNHNNDHGRRSVKGKPQSTLDASFQEASKIIVFTLFHR